jgi:uncharacterized protein (TIGR02246 family)
MKKVLAGMAVLAFASATADAQNNKDLEALQKLPQLHCDAWNNRDARALANLFAEDGDFVTVATVYLHGRKDYETFHARLLQGRFKDSKFEPVHTTVRFLRPDLAVIHWSWKMTGDKNFDGTERSPRFGMMTILAEKRAGTWQIEVAQNTNSLLGTPPELEGIKTPIPVPGSDTPAK